MSDIFFFDTYAFIEIIRGNPNYKRFENVGVITTAFNLAELNYILKKEMAKEKADAYLHDYWIFAADVSMEDIKAAIDLKIKHKELSIPDVVGYIVASKYGVKFLTGDSGFSNMPNVEFVR